MFINLFRIFILITLSSFSNLTLSGQLLPGTYESLDGKIQHTFTKSGEYSGIATYPEGIYEGTGLYEHGGGICWTPSGASSKGNVILYVGGSKCCLEFRPISNKFAVNKVWITGKVSGVGAALCVDHLLQMK